MRFKINSVLSSPFLDENKVYTVFQSGFHKKHFTETAVVYLVDRILQRLDKQQLTGAALIY